MFQLDLPFERSKWPPSSPSFEIKHLPFFTIKVAYTYKKREYVFIVDFETRSHSVAQAGLISVHSPNCP